MNYIEIETQEQLATIINNETEISKYAFQNLDFCTYESELQKKTFEDCLFLGCELSEKMVFKIYTSNAIFPKLEMPYNSYVNALYTKENLYNNYKVGNPETYELTLDKKVYNHFIATGKEASDIKETLARRLHDHSVTDALYDFLDEYADDKKVAIMGGHSLSRADAGFTTVAKISKSLTEKGYLMLSGGGPGAMEATHVGAWFAGKPEAELLDAIAILANSFCY